MSTVCVVGGGIAGLFGALILAEKGHKVILIESAAEVGGLLKSFRNSLGEDFDYGTHIYRETGVAEIDRMLFSNLSETWKSFEVLRTGSILNGKLFSKSAFINANFLNPADLAAAEQEFLAAPPNSLAVESVVEYTEKKFGKGFAQKLFNPVLEKLFGVTVEKLHRAALKQFGMSRIVAFTPEKTRELKKDSWHDERLAFHSFEEGVSGLKNFYPSTGGIGLFVENLTERLLKKGVEIRCNEKIENIEMTEDRVACLQTNTGEIKVDHLVWTLPIPFLNKLAQINSTSVRPEFRDVALFYFTFEKPFNSDLYYLMNFDPGMKSFRITLYQNLKGQSDGPYSCCIEVLGKKEELERLDSSTLLQELSSLNLISSNETPIAQEKRMVPSGFPILSKEFVQGGQTIYQEALRNYKNVSFVGKSSGNAFFMNDVLIDTYNQLSKI